jgi:hypothetical protein
MSNLISLSLALSGMLISIHGAIIYGGFGLGIMVSGIYVFAGACISRYLDNR